MQNYWLYLGNNPMNCVRLPVGSSDQAVKRKALDELEVVPGVFTHEGYAPFEHRANIHRAEVKL